MIFFSLVDQFRMVWVLCLIHPLFTMKLYSPYILPVFDLASGVWAEMASDDLYGKQSHTPCTFKDNWIWECAKHINLFKRPSKTRGVQRRWALFWYLLERRFWENIGQFLAESKPGYRNETWYNLYFVCLWRECLSF